MVRQPLWSMREFCLVPLPDPKMVLSHRFSRIVSAVITFIQYHVLETIRLEVGGNPIGVTYDVLLSHLAVVCGPAIPHDRCGSKMGVIKRDVEGDAQGLRKIIRKRPYECIARYGNLDIKDVLILRITRHHRSVRKTN